MRKAIIAAIVATALFAVGAFAASFAVGSEDIASGGAPVDSCADSALVEYTTRPNLNQTSTDFVLASITVTFMVDGTASTPTDNCDGALGDIAILSGDGDPLTDGEPTRSWDDLGAVTIGGTTSTQAIFAVPADMNIEVEPIEGVTVLADGNKISTP